MRCSWAKSKEAIKYHDDRWCKETHDEKMLFKMLVLEGMQAGLSWDTILKKEEAYNQAFDDFDYHKIASYSKEKIESLYASRVIESIIFNVFQGFGKHQFLQPRCVLLPVNNFQRIIILWIFRITDPEGLFGDGSDTRWNRIGRRTVRITDGIIVESAHVLAEEHIIDHTKIRVAI